MKKITIAIDAMGGDNSPNKTIGGVELLNKHSKQNDFILNLFGDKNRILNEFKRLNISTNNVNIIHADSVVSDEKHLTAVKILKIQACGIVLSLRLMETRIYLSAGNTGVLLVISRMILKMMTDVNKPALAGLWPNKRGMNVVLDLGANIECNDDNLIDFAELGSALYKSIFPKEKPLVSLLNIGSEEIKGTENLKKAFKRLNDLSDENNFLFKGYIEGNEIMSGAANVIVTDGFTGNVALKTAEGTAKNSLQIT